MAETPARGGRSPRRRGVVGFAPSRRCSIVVPRPASLNSSTANANARLLKGARGTPERHSRERGADLSSRSSVGPAGLCGALSVAAASTKKRMSAVAPTDGNAAEDRLKRNERRPGRAGSQYAHFAPCASNGSGQETVDSPLKASRNGGTGTRTIRAGYIPETPRNRHHEYGHDQTNCGCLAGNSRRNRNGTLPTKAPQAQTQRAEVPPRGESLRSKTVETESALVTSTGRIEPRRHRKAGVVKRALRRTTSDYSRAAAPGKPSPVMRRRLAPRKHPRRRRTGCLQCRNTTRRVSTA